MSDLAGRVFVVTGTASGIDARLALRLAERGASIIGVDIESDRGQEVCNEIRRQSGNSEVEFIAADVASYTEVRALAAKIAILSDRVDMLINNAGIVESIRRARFMDVLERGGNALPHSATFFAMLGVVLS